jgi:hypothetical protein
VKATDPHPRLQFSNATTVRLLARPSKVARELFVDPDSYEPGMAGIERLIPSILAGEDLRSLADAWASAVRRGRSVVLGMGAHPIKVGLSRLIVDLLDRGFLHLLAANGAAAIHDLEMAMIGRTRSAGTSRKAMRRIEI